MISHEHRFIFVQFGRAGGSSLERMAGAQLAADLPTRVRGNTESPEKHWPFERDRQRHPEESGSYFKCTIVRNPFERPDSSWISRIEAVGDLRGMSLRQFIESRPPNYGLVAKFRLEGMKIEESSRPSVTSPASSGWPTNPAFSRGDFGSGRLRSSRTRTAPSGAAARTPTTRRPWIPVGGGLPTTCGSSDAASRSRRADRVAGRHDLPESSYPNAVKSSR